MAVTAAAIKAFAPELAGVADSVISTWIGWAPGSVSARVFGAAHDQAVTLWVCHQALRQQASGTVGPVTSEEVSDVKTTANGGTFAPGSYDTTSYGVELGRLMRRYTAGPRVVL